MVGLSGGVAGLSGKSGSDGVSGDQRNRPPAADSVTASKLANPGHGSPRVSARITCRRPELFSPSRVPVSGTAAARTSRCRSQSSGSTRGRSLASSWVPVRLSCISSGRVEVVSTASDHSMNSCWRLPAIAIVRHSIRTAGSTGRRSTIFQPGARTARVENEAPEVADQAISAEAIQPDWLRSIRARTSAARDRRGWPMTSWSEVLAAIWRNVKRRPPTESAVCFQPTAANVFNSSGSRTLSVRSG